MPRRVGAVSAGIVAPIFATAVVMGCAGISDPGYTVAVKNESDVALIVRGERFVAYNEQSRWLLPPHSADSCS